MAYGNTFMRYEKKYLINNMQYLNLREKLKKHMVVDEYGLSTISNIYCDNECDELIFKSISKPEYKEKLRLRCYGKANENSVAFLEIKKKFKGVVYKRRKELPLNIAQAYLNGEELPLDNQVMREIDYVKNFYNLRPKIMITYDRIAMYGIKDKEFRITFDSNIRSRRDDLDLTKGDYGEKLLEDGNYVMEIKVDVAIPLWMDKILREEKIYPSSFSKYGKIYEKEYSKKQ